MITQSAKQIIDMCDAVALFGVTVITSGITHKLATTLTALGIRLRVTTVRDVAEALALIAAPRQPAATVRV